MKKTIIVVILVIIGLIGAYFFIKGDELNSKIPSSIEDCQKIDVTKYCPSLKDAEVLYLPPGQIIQTRQGATTRYDGEGVGVCSWLKVNADNQPITQEEQNNLKSIGLQLVFFENEAKASSEFKQTAQLSNATISNNKFTSIGSLATTQDYPFNNRVIWQNNGKINVNVVQFSAKQVSFYCSPSEEQALLDAFK